LDVVMQAVSDASVNISGATSGSVSLRAGEGGWPRLSVGFFFLLQLAMAFSMTGCQQANHYYAENSVFGERLPDRLRLSKQANPQEVDLSRLGSVTGTSQTIGVGDVLEVQIAAGLGNADQSTTAARVQEDGTISLPELGEISIAGVEPQAAEALIRAEAVRLELYHNPTVTVSVKHQKMNKVRVLGAVKNEGLYDLPPNASDVVSALAAAGGLAEEAGEKVEVRNPASALLSGRSKSGDGSVRSVSSSDSAGMASYTINLLEAAKSGEGQYRVSDGGVVMVEKRDPAPIFVQGLVKAPNRYEYPIGQDLRLLQAISLAGGMSNQLADKIFVIRQPPGTRVPILIQVSYRKAKRSDDSNIRLGPGDVVSVEQTPGTVFMEALNIIRFGVTGSTMLF
jgi:polysaccharide export outer membrane protein